jgi:TonB family protein
MSYQSLLFCPDEKTARVVTQVLTELEFSVELSNEPFATVKKLMAKQYDAIVVDCDNEQNAALLFKSARNSTSNQACLAVAVVEGQAGVAKAFRIGANLVLTKPVNVEQSKGTLRVARGLLRKAETGKAAPSTSLAPIAAGVSQPPVANLKSTGVITPFPHAAPSISTAAFARASAAKISNIAIPDAVSSAAFEIEEDPTPQPEPTEVAFLQSIPEPAVSRTSSQHSQTSQTHKESPWLQLSRPVGEGKVPASGNNLQTPLKRPSDSTLDDLPKTTRHPFNTGLSSVQGAGAAAAPAREATAHSVARNFKPASGKAAASSHQSHWEAEPHGVAALSIESSSDGASGEAPVFASATNETKASKVPLIAAFVLLALAAAGYMGWNKMQTGAMPLILQNKPAVPQNQPSTSAGTEFAQPGPQTTQSQATTAPPQQVPQLDTNQPAESSASPTAISGKSEPAEIVVVENGVPPSATAAKPLSIKKSPEPLAVKTVPASVEPTLAPPPLQVASSATDQTIAGLITTTLPAPKRSTEATRVSQGITEGMLVKKVSPIYPSQARQMRKEGVVQILANITKSGSISSAKLIKGDAMLGQAALVAVKQWKYKPYTLDGQAVEVQTQISVNFKLP